MADSILTKICNKCGVSKTIDSFYQKSGCCKPCHNEKSRQYLLANGEKIREQVNSKRAQDPEYYRARSRDSYAADPERYRAYAKQSAARHRDSRNQKALQKYHEHRDTRLEVIRKYYQENRDRLAARKRAKYKTNPELFKRSKHKRKLADGLRNDFTTTQWEQIKAFYKQRCAFCSTKAKLTRDHLVPLLKGGENTAANIIPLCLSCNASKGNRDPRQTFQPHLFMA